MSEKCIRISAVIAAIYTLLQGLIWSGVAIFVVSVFTCQTAAPFEESAPNTTGYLFYLAYLKGHCEGYEARSAGRTFIFMMVYSFLSSIWIPTAVLLLVAVLKSVKGSHTKYFYLPWILITFCIAVLDVVATVYYAMDISKTLTVSDFQDFIDPKGQMKLHLVGVEGLTVVPAAVMTVFFSRGIVLWIVNAFLLGFAIQGMKINARKNPHHRRHQQSEPREEHTLKTIEEMDMNRRRWINPTDGRDHKRYTNNQGRGDRRQESFKNTRFNEEEEDRYVNRGFESQEEQPIRIEPTVIQVRPESTKPKVSGEGRDLKERSTNETPRDAVTFVPPGLRRMVFDVNGKPTDERMTPPHLRPENKGLIVPSSELSGYNKPWSYTQPPIESVSVRQTEEGTENPAIPVPDYSIRIPKK